MCSFNNVNTQSERKFYCKIKMCYKFTLSSLTALCLYILHLNFFSTLLSFSFFIHNKNKVSYDTFLCNFMIIIQNYSTRSQVWIPLKVNVICIVEVVRWGFMVNQQKQHQRSYSLYNTRSSFGQQPIYIFLLTFISSYVSLSELNYVMEPFPLYN